MVLEADAAAPVDGYLVYQINCWNRVVQTMAAKVEGVSRETLESSAAMYLGMNVVEEA